MSESARSILKHLYKEGRMTQAQYEKIDRNLKERPHEKWEYLKEHITEMRDADGELNQKQTCQFILSLMGVIEREGEASDTTSDNR